MPGQFGNAGGTGNPGYSKNKKMKELVELSADWALAKMRSELPEDKDIKKEIVLKVVAKAVPQNIEIETPELPSIPLTKEEKELYAQLRLGLLQRAVTGSEPGASADMGNGQRNQE